MRIVMIFRFLCIFSLASTAFLTTTPAFPADEPDTIVIGQAIDLSSPNAAVGRDYVAGIKTYFDALNAAGGINGKRIRYVTRDDQASPQIAARVATELIERDRADYLLGGVGDNVTQAILNAPAFKRSNMLLYAPLVDAREATGSRILFWRPDYLQEVRHILSHFSQLGMKDVGVVYQDGGSTRQAFQALSAELKERNLKLTGTVRIGSDEKQNAQEAVRLAAARPGFVIVIGDTIGTALFLKEFRKSAPQTFVAGTSLTNLETLRELAGPRAVEWTVFSQVVPNPNNSTTTLQSEHLNMMKKYRDEPPSALTLEGFAVARTLALAIKRAKRPGTAMQELTKPGATIDIGGLTIAASPNNRLSGYVDIALFKKGALMF